jgi:hypothetical protein
VSEAQKAQLWTSEDIVLQMHPNSQVVLTLCMRQRAILAFVNDSYRAVVKRYIKYCHDHHIHNLSYKWVFKDMAENVDLQNISCSRGLKPH